MQRVEEQGGQGRREEASRGGRISRQEWRGAEWSSRQERSRK